MSERPHSENQTRESLAAQGVARVDSEDTCTAQAQVGAARTEEGVAEGAGLCE